MKNDITRNLAYLVIAFAIAIAVSWQPSSLLQQSSHQPVAKLRETDLWGTVIDGRAVIPMGTTLVKLDRGDVVPVPTKETLIPGERVNLKQHLQPNLQQQERQ